MKVLLFFISFLISFASQSAPSTQWNKTNSLIVDELYIHKKSSKIRLYINKGKIKKNLNIEKILKNYLTVNKKPISGLRKEQKINASKMEKISNFHQVLFINGSYKILGNKVSYLEWVEIKKTSKVHTKLIYPNGFKVDQDFLDNLKEQFNLI